MDNPTRLRRLKQLRKILKYHWWYFPRVSFNINKWAEDKPGIHVCGTAACALGSAAMFKPFIKEGLFLSGIKGLQFPAMRADTGYGWQGYYAGARFFGITRDESGYLFAPETYRKEFGDNVVVKRSNVIYRIDKLIHKYERLQ